MKKKIIILFMLIFTLTTTAVFADGEVEGIGSYQKLVINDEVTGVVGYNIDDYNYYRLRDLAALFKTKGLNFSLWGDMDKIIANFDEVYDETEFNPEKVTRGDKVKALKKSMDLIRIRDNNSSTDRVTTYNVNGYNYFKLRDVGDFFGFKVEYDSRNNNALVFIEEKSSTTISGNVVLGNERLLSEYSYLINGKNIGLITNQTGIDSRGVRTVDKLNNYPGANLVAVYSPEHGLDGKQKAGAYVESYYDDFIDLPVYSLYGKTREPSSEMLSGIDALIFDIQDIGSRTYTYVSTMNYGMRAAAKKGIPFIILDRPNPIGDIVEGFTLEPKYATFVGVDVMPMSHGMTIGELGKYYNRKIDCDLKVVEMKNYNRSMIWQETGLPFSQTSPNIPNLESAFNYMATGIGDGTGFVQGDKFAWAGAKGLDANEFSKKMNSYNLPGVRFIPEIKGERGGVRLDIKDYKVYNPQLTGTYLLATANQMTDLNIPREKDGVIPMFEKIHGSSRMGDALLRKLDPEEIVELYKTDVEIFKKVRSEYLIYK